MSEVVCDNCGERCSVPFKPTGGKPVYCSKCFRDKEDSASKGKINSYESEFAKINGKLDKILEALEID